MELPDKETLSLSVATSASRFISKIKDQQALPGEKECIVLKDLKYITKDLNVFAN